MPTTITATADQPLEQGVYAVTVGPFVDETGDAVTPSASVAAGKPSATVEAR